MKPPKHQHICPGCFRKKGHVDVCPYCGFDESARPNPIVLPYWTLLNRQYLTGRVLGKLGGFGITYLAWDTRLDKAAAVKEYLPRDFAGRDATGLSVLSHSPEDEKMFSYGLKLFLDEAKTLAKFDHPNIVRVRNVFENNGTAYLVMDYLEGESLHEYLQRKRGLMDENLAMEILSPVLDGLEEVHNVGFLHRDIKPQNLYLTNTGRTILLDFGAARQAIGESGRSRSVMLTPGYAPFEQYHRRGNQGPWTDVYACAAVFYCMVTGVTPPESTERVEVDSLADPRGYNPKLSPTFAQALLQGLALQPKDRPQSIAEFRQSLVQAGPKPRPADSMKTWTTKLAGQSQPTQTGRDLSTVTRQTVAAIPGGPRDHKRLLQLGIGAVLLVAGAASYPFWGRLADKLAASSNAPKPNATPALAIPPPAAPLHRSPPSAGVGIPRPAPAPSISATSAATPVPPLPTQSGCTYCPKLVNIPAGEFWMGSNVGDDIAQLDEKPRHKVRVEGFALGQFEITQGQWQQIMGSNPSMFANCGDNCPVENVSWREVQAFITKLNQLTGLRCRLPTEAEWEYACRGGATGQAYCGGDDADALGWHERNAQAAHPVGGKQPNAFGLYDMSGNVWEWTASVYRPYPYQAHDGRETLLEAAPGRVLRGGFWGLPVERARASSRSFSPADLRNFDLGFRVACNLAKGGR